jgi:uncharacterized protein YecE (DUF72 family)
MGWSGAATKTVSRSEFGVFANMGETRIGISGWTYPPWRGRFYPKGWPQHRELEYASRQVSSIEINGSFYALQRPESYGAWYAASPGGFVFSIKGSRFITHMKRLKDVETPLANFFASGVLRLEEKLGPFLWQLPPSFRFDPERLGKFFNLLPRDTPAAAKLSKKHDERLHGRAWTKTDRTRPLRHAIEVRHSSFETREFIALLREHDIALVVADTAGKWPLIEDPTSDFVYVRLHGAKNSTSAATLRKHLGYGGERCAPGRKGKRPPERDCWTNDHPQRNGRCLFTSTTTPKCMPLSTRCPWPTSSG